MAPPSRRLAQPFYGSLGATVRVIGAALDLPHSEDMFTMMTSIFVAMEEGLGGVAVVLVELID